MSSSNDDDNDECAERHVNTVRVRLKELVSVPHASQDNHVTRSVSNRDVDIRLLLQTEVLVICL